MRIHREPPTVAEFIDLIRDVGWERYTNIDVLDRALAASLCCVVARDDGGTAIGMGRLVGDGVRFVYFQDIIVRTGHQKRRVGTAIMDALFAWINAHCPNKTYLHLFTDPATASFYRRFGFEGPETPFFGMSQKKFAKRVGRRKE